MFRFSKTTILLSLAIIATAMPASAAQIAMTVGLSGNANVGDNPIHLPSSPSINGTLGIRFGESVTLTPELELTYLNSLRDARSDNVNHLFHAMAGARLGLVLGDLEPSAYVHFGLGNVNFRDNDAETSQGARLVEAGCALDLRMLSILRIGAQVGYVGASISDIADSRNDVRWLRIGARASVVF